MRPLNSLDFLAKYVNELAEEARRELKYKREELLMAAKNLIAQAADRMN